MGQSKSSSATTTMHLIFDEIITRFGCPKILMSDQGTHFINNIVEYLTKEFAAHHQNITPYHPQANGTVEAFNKILETTLTNICSVNKDNWDLSCCSNGILGAKIKNCFLYRYG
jgi:transposase InsO family protein